MIKLISVVMKADLVEALEDFRQLLLFSFPCREKYRNDVIKIESKEI